MKSPFVRRSSFLKTWKLRNFFGRTWTGRGLQVAEWITGGWRLPTVSVSTMPKCSLHCGCCPWRSYRDSCNKMAIGPLSTEIFSKCLTNIPLYVLVEFCGASEPFLNQSAADMIRLAWDSGHRMQLMTTLVGLKRRDAEKLQGIKFEKFCVHAPDSTNMPYNEDRWLGWLENLRGLKLSPVVFMALGPMSDRVRSACESLGSLVPIHIQNKKTVSHEEPLFKTGPIECGTYCKGLNYTMLWPNGDLSYCCWDYVHEYVLGNLSETPYKQLINGPTRKTIEAKKLSFRADCLCRHCEEAILR